MNIGDLKQKQSLPLELKVLASKEKIRQWYEHYNGEVYVSFSGGKDSTVLLHLVRSKYPDVKAVFSNTGLEYPEIVDFVKTFDNVDIIRPKISFRKVLEKYGYPIISKSQAMAIRKLKNQNLTVKFRNKLMYGDERGTAGKLSNKYHFLLNPKIDFKISEECCTVMKKRPFKVYEKRTGLKVMTGEMTDESINRQIEYLKQGCNAWEKEKSTPLAPWLNQDILEYIELYNLRIPKVYGNIYKDLTGRRYLDGVQRTGCIFCMFGLGMEEYPNRFQRLQHTHPKLYKYCMKDLNIEHICKVLKLPYKD